MTDDLDFSGHLKPVETDWSVPVSSSWSSWNAATAIDEKQHGIGDGGSSSTFNQAFPTTSPILLLTPPPNGEDQFSSLPPTLDNTGNGVPPPFPPLPPPPPVNNDNGLLPPPFSNGLGLENNTAAVTPFELPTRPRIFSEPQRKAIAYAPKGTAMLSMMGSAWIVYELLVRDRHRVKLRSTYHKIILLMSGIDFCSSFWLFVGTWAVQEFKPNPNAPSFIIGASGNQATCTAQGFFMQLGLTAPFYNTSLAVYSLLAVKYGWQERRIKRSASRWLLGLPILLGLGTAIAGLPLELYNKNPTNHTCWIAPLPYSCDTFFLQQDHDNDNGGLPPPIPCVRGENATIYLLAFAFAPLWMSLLAMIVCMFLVAHKVWKLEKSSQRWIFHHQLLIETEGEASGMMMNNSAKSSRIFCNANRNAAANSDSGSRSSMMMSANTTENTSSRQGNIISRSMTALFKFKSQTNRTRKVVQQALWFVAAFLITWATFMAYQTVLTLNPHFKETFGAVLTASILLPAQGFLNFLIFMRPRYVTYCEKNPEWKWYKALLGQRIWKCITCADGCGSCWKLGLLSKRPPSPKSKESPISVISQVSDLLEDSSNRSDFNQKDEHHEEPTTVTMVDVPPLVPETTTTIISGDVMPSDNGGEEDDSDKDKSIIIDSLQDIEKGQQGGKVKAFKPSGRRRRRRSSEKMVSASEEDVVIKPPGRRQASTKLLSVSEELATNKDDDDNNDIMPASASATGRRTSCSKLSASEKFYKMFEGVSKEETTKEMKDIKEQYERISKEFISEEEYEIMFL